MKATTFHSFYRPEIDGLRTIAVLPVILFHAGFAYFSGGFVGVDIFFVISGYLITTILAKEMAEGKYSIMEFYERRARRILPALLFVIIVSLPFAMWWLASRDLGNLGKSMIGVGTFASNLFFWSNTSYFDPQAADQPLLHTWSLSVEEQYYIFLPIIMFLVWKYARRALLPFLIVAAIGSLALAQWASVNHATGNFYMLPTRAWELMAGSIVALVILEWAPRDRGPVFSKFNDGALAAIGLGMIVYSIFKYDENTVFPTLYTLTPVLGTCMVILFSTRTCAVGRLLSLKPLVAIGLVSYSAYLWHQPIFALYRLSPMFQFKHEELIFTGLILATFVLAWFSWRFVELPFRQRERFNRKQVMSMAAASLAFLILTGGAMAIHYSVREEVNPDIAKCDFMPSHPEARCLRIGNGPRQVVIIGDSHSFPLLGALQKDANNTVTVITIPGCPPLIGIHRFDHEPESKSCEKPDDTLAYAKAVVAMHPDRLMLVSRWTMYVHGIADRHHKLGATNHLTTILASSDTALNPQTQAQQIVSKGLTDTLAWYKEQLPDTALFVMEQTPDLQMYGRVNRVTQQIGSRVPRGAIDTWDASSETMLADAARESGATVVPTKASFCDKTSCAIADGKELFYTDDNHLSPSGAKHLTAALNQDLLNNELLSSKM